MRIFLLIFIIASQSLASEISDSSCLAKLREIAESMSRANVYNTRRDFTSPHNGYNLKFPNAPSELIPYQAVLACRDCTIVDVGAGRAGALRELLQSSGQNIRTAAAFAISMPNDADLVQALEIFPNLHYLTGFVEDMPLAGLSSLGLLHNSDFIFDIMGAIQYSPQIDTVLLRYGDLLKENGYMYLSFVSDLTYRGAHYPPAIRGGPVTMITDQNNTTIELEDFFSMIRGVDILHQERIINDRSKEHIFSIIMRRNSEDFFVPRLRLKHINESMSIPGRHFELD